MIGQAPTVANAVITQTSVPLMEFANDGAAGRAWNAYNQTVNSGGPTVAGRPSPIEYGITVHVYARAANGDLMEFINDDAGHRLWNSYDLTQITQGPTFAADPDATFFGRSVHVYGEAPNGDLIEVINDDAGGRLWNSYDLTTAANGPTLGGDATPLVNGSSDWVFARASDGDLVEFTNDGANGQLWNAYDLTQEASGPAIADDPEPDPRGRGAPRLRGVQLRQPRGVRERQPGGPDVDLRQPHVARERAEDHRTAQPGRAQRRDPGLRPVLDRHPDRVRLRRRQRAPVEHLPTPGPDRGRRPLGDPEGQHYLRVCPGHRG